MVALVRMVVKDNRVTLAIRGPVEKWEFKGLKERRVKGVSKVKLENKELLVNKVQLENKVRLVQLA
jgi:hypothetical protein